MRRILFLENIKIESVTISGVQPASSKKKMIKLRINFNL